MNDCKGCGAITTSIYHTASHVVCYACLEKAILVYIENKVPSLHARIKELETLVKKLQEEK